jgi:hypothetical protein
MGHSRQEAVNERETGIDPISLGNMLSHVGTRPLLQDGSWPDGDVVH